MRLVRSGLLLAIVVALLAIQLAPGVLAQDDATPTAATPVAADDPLAGRLGGPLTSVIDAFGPADYTEAGLIRYDALDLNGLLTILVVYHDEEDIVTRLALVYLTRPETLTTPEDVLALAATVAPADGECQPEAAETSLGARGLSLPQRRAHDRFRCRSVRSPRCQRRIRRLLGGCRSALR